MCRYTLCCTWISNADAHGLFGLADMEELADGMLQEITLELSVVGGLGAVGQETGKGK